MEGTEPTPREPARACKWCRRPVTPAGALESEHPELCSWHCGEEYRAKFPTREAWS